MATDDLLGVKSMSQCEEVWEDTGWDIGRGSGLFSQDEEGGRAQGRESEGAHPPLMLSHLLVAEGASMVTMGAVVSVWKVTLYGGLMLPASSWALTWSTAREVERQIKRDMSGDCMGGARMGGACMGRGLLARMGGVAKGLP